jgi:hypothetical protein
MRILFAAIAGLTIALAPAHGVVSETVELDAGPGGNRLSPVWLMKCSSGERIVGLRLYDDGRVAGVRAICARVRMDESGARWLGVPALLPEPSPPPPPRMETVKRVIDLRGEGTILHASSEGVTRQRSSRALMITIERPVENAGGEAGGVERVDFHRTSRARFADIVCPADRVVVGLRLGIETAPKRGDLRAVQVVCGDGLGHTLEPAGDWPQAEPPRGKKGKRRPQEALKAQRIECGSSGANPHDGIAARAIFGTEEGGRVQSIGLSCTGSLDALQPRSRLFDSMRTSAAAALRALNWTQRIEEPKWLDGARIAACGANDHDTSCMQDRADRYCIDVAGYGRSSEFAVGRFATDAVVPGGERCERSKCRAFASITCAF